MYEERKDKFTLKDIIIQVLFVGVFIFLLMWLFPMKSGIKKSLTPLYDQIFNDNVQSMKEAAISYYTTPRLPKKIGEEKKMTLSEMLDLNIVLPFADRNGKQCDLMESYVSMTKMDDEYILKVNLKCGDQEDYLLVHLGCYDYCEGDVCEKEPEKEPETKPTTTPDKPSNPTPTPTPEKQYMYEYVKVINGKWGEYSDWSEWTTNVIEETEYRQVEKWVDVKEKEVLVNKTPIYENQCVRYKTESYVVDKTPIYKDVCAEYKTEQVVDTKTPIYNNVCVKYKTKEQKVNHSTTSCPTYVKMEYVSACDGCTAIPKAVTVTDYKNCKTVDNWVTETVTTDECAEFKQKKTGKYEYTYKTVTTNECARYEKKATGEYNYTYGTRTTNECAEFKQVETGKYDEVYEKVTEKTTYYRSRTREYISGSMDTKWSTSQKDTSLTSKGYSLTGNSCVVGVNCPANK